MRETLFIALLLVACGDDEARPGTDASVDHRDMATVDASTSDGFVAPSDGGPDARPPDAARSIEDCSTDLDEDADGRAGCADVDCFGESRCIEADLVDRGIGDWTVCQTLSFDAAATRARCEEGLPPWTDSSRELRCDIAPTEVAIDVYCDPEATEDETVEVRWRIEMDLTGSDRMLGPQTYESTSYMAELFFSNTVTEFGAGGSSGDSLDPTAEDWSDYRAVAVGWRTLPRGARFIAFTTISIDVSTFYLFDGGVDVSSSGPDYVHNAAFEIPSAGNPG